MKIIQIIILKLNLKTMSIETNRLGISPEERPEEKVVVTERKLRRVKGGKQGVLRSVEKTINDAIDADPEGWFMHGRKKNDPDLIFGGDSSSVANKEEVKKNNEEEVE